MPDNATLSAYERMAARSTSLSSWTRRSEMLMDIAELFTQRERERYALHDRYLNDQMVRVLQAIGYDIGFCHGRGQYLYTRDGTRYLDLLSGYGVFAIGRNHPKLRDALKSVLDANLPNLIQMDVSTLAGILAERLLTHVPYLDKALFVNSGSEAVEAAIKLARAATGRPGIVYCEHAFHGLSYGALSLNGDAVFRKGFEPLLPNCVRIPFNDLFALERALHSRTIAAFIVEPIQGKGVNMPTNNYVAEAARLCRKYGTLLVADEVQTGMGRALEHRTGHDTASQDPVGRARASRRCSYPKENIWKGLRSHGSRGGTWIDLRQQ
jgi:ornithine--oxo-acid transaminase